MKKNKENSERRYWELRSLRETIRRPPEYFGTEGALELLDICLKYFDWLEEFPLHEAKLVSFQGNSSIETLPKKRIPTVSGLSLFIGVTSKTWNVWRSREDLKQVTELIDQLIATEQLEGAAADLINPMITARILGLKDKISNEHSGNDGGPIKHELDTPLKDLTPDEAKSKLKDYGFDD